MNNLARIADGFAQAAPQAPEAEVCLLAAIMHRNSIYEKVSDSLTPEHFYNERHAIIYRAMGELIQKGHAADPVSLHRFFEQNDSLSQAGGADLLARIAGSVITFINAPEYARIIVDMARRRDLVAIAQDLQDAAYSDGIEVSAEDVLAQHETALTALVNAGVAGGRTQGPQPWSTVADEAMKEWQAAYNGETPPGLTTGLVDLDATLGGLFPGDLILLGARPSMGKAQPLDAKVRTATGWRAMGDIRFGDALASVDGAPSMVTGVFPQGLRQVYRLTFSDGRSTEACGEHLWSVRSCKWVGAKVFSTDRLRDMLRSERHRRRIYVDVPSGHFGAAAELPVEPWLLGALIGNGGLTDRQIMFSTADAETLWRVANSPGMRVSYRESYDYRISSEGAGPTLRDRLTELGLYGKRSEEKRIPQAYLDADRESRLQLLRGLVDTDGWVEKLGTVRYSTSSPGLANDVAELVRSLGGLCTINRKDEPKYTYRGEDRIGLPHFTCNIRHDDATTLMHLHRKRERAAAKREKPVRLTIMSIEPTRIAETQCISVSHPSRLYITDDYVVTHNTTLAQCMAIAAARKFQETGDPRKVLFFSLEQPGRQLVTRDAVGQTGIAMPAVRAGRLDKHDMSRLMEAAMARQDMPILLDSRGRLSAGQIAATTRRHVRKDKVAMIFIDYLGIMWFDDRYRGNLVQEISEASAALKTLAKELDIPVVLLSQLSRQVEARENKRPQLADLRDSGALEQNADVVAFIYREEYYLSRQGEPVRAAFKTEEAWNNAATRHEAMLTAAANKAEIIVAKNRSGPCRTVFARFDALRMKFENLARE